MSSGRAVAARTCEFDLDKVRGRRDRAGIKSEDPTSILGSQCSP